MENVLRSFRNFFRTGANTDVAPVDCQAILSREDHVSVLTEREKNIIREDERDRLLDEAAYDMDHSPGSFAMKASDAFSWLLKKDAWGSEMRKDYRESKKVPSTIMASNDLKPCPFCGSDVELKPSNRERLLQFVCTDPNSSCHGSGMFQCCMIENKEAAIETWNRRA